MSVRPRQLPLALETAIGYSIHDFVVTGPNSTAFKFLKSWPQWPSPLVVLAGREGSGKSHLAAIWAAQSFAVQFDKKRLDPAIEAASQGIPVLLEDMAPGCFDETELFHLINVVQQGQVNFPLGSLLMTSRLRPADWQIKLLDLASRLKAISLIEISPPDDALLNAIMAKLFADRQLVIESQLISYVLNRIERCPAKMIEFVKRVDRIALEQKSKITRQLVIDVLASMQMDTDPT
ncbi:MAG: ATPase involved in DNA replication initiation [Candidatus Tokpelaia sp. JSC189]|nr:MAG: ATPase involved in DNA replication initiation [Candidatus Tokpelaia sp. JSC189]